MASNLVPSSAGPTLLAARTDGLIASLLRRMSLTLSRVVSRADHRLRSTARYIAAAVTLAALQVVLIVVHQPWLDEAQGLLVAVKPATLSQVFAQLHYEGHPALWYLLLRGLHAFLPFEWVLRAASILIGSLFWWTVLSSGRFSRAEKLLLLSSALVLIEYTAISRSLGLGVAIFFVALHWWRRPLVWLPLALLPQCDFLFGVLSAMLIAVRLRDGWSPGVRVPPVGALLWLGSSVLAAMTVFPAADVVTTPPRQLLTQAVSFLSQTGALSAPLQLGRNGPEWSQTFFPGVLGLPATIGLIALLPGRKSGDRAIIVGFVLFVCLFAVFVYPLYFRHVSLIAVWLIGAYWIDEADTPGRRTAWRAWLASMAACGMVGAGANIVQPFDTAHVFAERIRAENLVDAPLVSFPDWHAIAVSSALDRPIGGLERGCSSTFVRWNTRHMNPIRSSAFRARVAGMSRRIGDFYLITPANFYAPTDTAKPVIVTPKGYSGESYALWKVTAPGRATAALPACVPG